MQWTWHKPARERLEAVFSSLHFSRCLMILNLPTSEPPINVDGSVLSDQKALPAGFINSTERWYGTPYLANGISVEQLKSLDNAAVDMDGIWKLPGSNRFIPDDIALVPGNTNLKPSLVHSAETSGANPSRSQVWHALDNSFDSPKQVYFLKFCYPTAHLWLLLVFFHHNSFCNLFAVHTLGNVLPLSTCSFCSCPSYCCRPVEIHYEQFATSGIICI